jgi:hypothetical protein
MMPQEPNKQPLTEEQIALFVDRMRQLACYVRGSLPAIEADLIVLADPQKLPTPGWCQQMQKNMQRTQGLWNQLVHGIDPYMPLPVVEALSKINFFSRWVEVPELWQDADAAVQQYAPICHAIWPPRSSRLRQACVTTISAWVELIKQQLVCALDVWSIWSLRGYLRTQGGQDAEPMLLGVWIRTLIEMCRESSGETMMEGTHRQTLLEALAQHPDSPVLCVAHRPSGTYIDVYMTAGYGYVYPGKSNGKSILVKSLPVVRSLLTHMGINDQQWYVVPGPYLPEKKQDAQEQEAVQRG